MHRLVACAASVGKTRLHIKRITLVLEKMPSGFQEAFAQSAVVDVISVQLKNKFVKETFVSRKMVLK